MCCTLEVVVTVNRSEAFYTFVQSFWGASSSGQWGDPPRRFLSPSASVRSGADMHHQPPEYWLKMVKYAVGLFEEARRAGFNPLLVQPKEAGCTDRAVTRISENGEVHLDRLCQVPKQQWETSLEDMMEALDG